MLFNQSPLPDENFQEGSDVHTLTGSRSGIGLLTAHIV